jgi:hypothetical protein
LVVYASTAPAASIDGTTYCSGKTVPPVEADLFDQTSGGLNVDPQPVLYNQAVLAVVQLTAVGTVSTNSTYIVMQGALDDGIWFDLAWITWNGLTGAADVFVISAGSAGASAFQQNRVNGTAPLGTEFNQCPLPGRLRFTGQATVTGGGSVTATVKFKQLGLR